MLEYVLLQASMMMIKKAALLPYNFFLSETFHIRIVRSGVILSDFLLSGIGHIACFHFLCADCLALHAATPAPGKSPDLLS